MKTLYKIILLLPALFSCVNLYDPGLKASERRLVVESQLTTRNEFQYIYLTYDSGYNGEETNFKFLVRKAKVNITDDQGKIFEFFDEIPASNQIKTPEGFNYRSVNKFQAVVGRKYKINIETVEGNKYESTFETVTKTSPINKTYTDFKAAAEPSTIAGNFNLYIDSKDEAKSTDFYMWRTKHIKQINYCREWYIYGQGGDVTQRFVDPCCQPCYETEICDDCYELANDRLVNGNNIIKQYVATVPYKDATPYYMIVSQYSLSEGAYRYWNALQKQSKNSGGLFDATPQSVKGNLRNINNPEEQVLGYFTVSDVHDQYIYVNRNINTPKPKAFEEYSTFQKTSVCFPCQESYNRTKIAPPGWRFQ
jgi:hypothetical protein